MRIQIINAIIKNLKMINDINTLKSLLTISERIVLKEKEGN
ncbi:hypothetical protein ACSXC4_16590 (plasmid) [Clostridium perfringens]|nr:hypothetical protein [Clostridium perfringens]MDK0897115.1 hypothetical protein [Clostridium perfringens]MDM0868814.1 hypothetical protein [Clostridium perfringens]MDU6691749.1 hypothetical protein [Clostridium perfringens]MEA5268905.1 hypothetical protein [Clostridium perfringens]MEA5380604.1 hypothetical protein [Clostridium perfringens]